MMTAVNKSSTSKYFSSFQMYLIAILLCAITASSRYTDGSDRTREEIACDGYEMDMQCPGTTKIRVGTTSYGRRDDRTCIVDPARMNNLHCSYEDAKEIVSNKCDGMTACSLTVGPSTFPNDPCPGTSKYLNVIWECVDSVVKCPGKLDSFTQQVKFVTTRDENAAWLRDPYQHTDKIYYMGWSKYESSQLNEFASGADLVDKKPITFYHLPDRVDGTGFVVLDGSVYYNKERSRTIVKYDMSQRQMTSYADLPNANYHDTSPYAIKMSTDIDMAVDESGLWVIYATEANNGNIVISKLQPNSLEILGTWRTSYEKLSALNAFIACGVLYAVNYDTLKIDYMFNTTSNTDHELSISIPGLNDTTSAIEYNPKDQMLYVWDDRVATAFKINFQEIVPPTATTTTSTTTRIPITTTTTTTSIFKTSTTIVPNSAKSTPPRPSFPSKPKFCPEKEASGLLWPKTTFSQKAFLDCPGGGKGQAIWICEGNATHPWWAKSQPDLSQCTSSWIKTLKEKVDSGREAISDLGLELVKNLNDKQSQMTSWDIVVIVKLLKQLLVETSSDIKTASSITDTILKCSSELLHPAIMHLWKGLRTSLRTTTAIDLANVLEEAAFFLAKDMIVNYEDSTPALSSSSSNRVTWLASYATLAIRIEPVFKSVDNQQHAIKNSQVVTLNSGHGDSVTIDDVSIMEALRVQAEEKVAIVHLSFKNLGSYLIDSHGFGDVNYPVNSQVITLSGKSMQTDGSWRTSSGSLKLNKPIVLNIHHNIPSYKYHVCAFWKDTQEFSKNGSWSRSGCFLVSGNQTHSTCKCNHLTDFAILSSDNVFPLMGGEITDGVSNPTSKKLIYVNVIRGGMIISVVFLLITAITLLRYSSTLDLNTVRKNLVISSLTSEVVFLVGIDQVSNNAACAAVAAILHYGVVCSFVWSALEPYHHLVCLTDLHERNHRWKYYYLIGYGLPAIVVGMSAAIKHEGYVNESVCWMQTNDGFIWSFVAPACLAIVICVLLVAVLMYKLSREKTNITEPLLVKNIRADAVCTCLLMFLFCAMWASGFMWLSEFQFQVTSWFFSILCAAHGITSFSLYCILPAEVCFLRGCLTTCWKTKRDAPFSYRSSTSGVQLVPSSSRRTTLRGEGSTSYSDPHYSGQTEATLIPVTETHLAALAKAATMMNGTEISPLVRPRPSATLSHDLVSHIRSRETRASSFSSLDDTDPKIPSMGYQRQSSTTTWNDYVHTDSRSCIGNVCNRSDHMLAQSNSCQVHGFHCSQQHSYEQPAPSYCACTSSTGHSCCYDRLHDELRYGVRGRPCSKCKPHSLGPLNSVAYQKASSTHLYETLGPFAEISEDGRTSEHESALLQSCSTAPTMHCHRYEDVAPDSTCMRVVEYPDRSDYERRFRNPDLSTELMSESSCVLTPNHCQNHICYSRQCRQKVSPGLLKGECAYYTTRNGRSSDPLSTATDQGYDTDPQQLNLLPCHSTHNDSEGVQLPSGVKSHVFVPMHGNDIGVTCNGVVVPLETTRHDTSRSVGSDCGSENDREVEIINSSSRRTPDTQLNKLMNTACSSTMHSRNDGTLNAIDTAKGGTISASGSVTSWSAFPGSNPRVSYPAYGQNRIDRKPKTTINPQEILAQARRSSVESLSNISNDDRSVDGANPPGYTGYTLPGTAQAGTKARIDLRTGGISMITNL